MNLSGGTGGVAIVGCQYSVPPILQDPERQNDLANLFQRAVYSTVLHHNLLQGSLVAQENGPPYWNLVPALNLDQLIRWLLVEPTEDYNDVRQHLLVRQLNTGFASGDEQAEWRVAVLRQPLSDAFEAFFIFSSAKFDGKCGKIFQEDVLHYLNFYSRRCDLKSPIPGQGRALPGAGLQGTKMPPRQSTASTPASESLVSSLSKGLSTWKKYTVDSLRLVTPAPAPAHVWPHVKEAQKSEAGLKTLVIPRHVVEGVVDVCRTRWDITITLLLQAMTMVSLARQIPVNEMPVFKSVTTIDLRQLMSGPVPVDIAGHQNGPRSPAKTMMNVVSQVTHDIYQDFAASIKTKSDHWNKVCYPKDLHRASVVSLAKSTHTIWPSGDLITAKPPRQPGGQPLGPEVKSSIWVLAALARSTIKAKLQEANDMLRGQQNSHAKGIPRPPPEPATFQLNNPITMDGVDPAVRRELEELARLEEEIYGEDEVPVDFLPIGLPPAPKQAPWMNKNLNMDGPYPRGQGWALDEPGLFQCKSFPHDLTNKRAGIVLEGWSSEVQRPSNRNGIFFKDWDAEFGKPLSLDLDRNEFFEKRFYKINVDEEQQKRKQEEQRRKKKREEQLDDNLANKTFSIKCASFAVSPQGTGAPIHLSVFTVKDGDMVIDLTYQKGVVADNVIETLAEDLQGWLPGISKGKEVMRLPKYGFK